MPRKKSTSDKKRSSTCFEPGNKWRFQPGHDPKNRGGNHKLHLLSRSIIERLGQRAPKDLCVAMDMPVTSSYSQLLAAKYIGLAFRGIEHGGLNALELIMKFTEPRTPLSELADALQGGASLGSAFEIRFVESDGNGRVREADLKSGYAQMPASEYAALPESTGPIIEAEPVDVRDDPDAPTPATPATPATPKPKRKITTEDRFKTALAKLGGDQGVSSYRPIRGAFRPGH